ncbi:MAG: hypothetical protein HC910_10090 [Spirulinaceae cyanobacterium SM2_1_0]|nr:hypothetical protein [Spirulinaceae cyanobacterium SM2_1_0]
MPVKPSHYETLLAEYSNRNAAIALLREYRPYLELIPSMRRPDESVIAIPLPVVRLRQPKPETATSHWQATKAMSLPCDLVVLTCDPEWKIKMGAEILIFIHRPHEDFSEFLSRWRHTQVYLNQDYEWLMPPRYEHILSEGSDRLYPLFIVFSETPDRIQRGLAGACLPYVVRDSDLDYEEPVAPEVTAGDELEIGD